MIYNLRRGPRIAPSITLHPPMSSLPIHSDCFPKAWRHRACRLNRTALWVLLCATFLVSLHGNPVDDTCIELAADYLCGCSSAYMLFYATYTRPTPISPPSPTSAQDCNGPQASQMLPRPSPKLRQLLPPRHHPLAFPLTPGPTSSRTTTRAARTPSSSC